MAAFLRALCIWAALLWAGPVLAAAVTLELRPQVTVERSLVLLGDLALVDTDDAALRSAVEQVVVGQAPLVGYVEQRSRAQLESLLRAQRMASRLEIAWRGGERAMYRTQSQRLDADAIVEAARQRLAESLADVYERVDVTLASGLPELAAPAGPVAYRVRPIEMAQPKPRVPVWVDVLVRGQVYRSVVVPLALRVYRKVYVAQRDLAAGELAVAAAFTLQVEEVGALPAAPLAVGELQGLGRTRHALARGQILAGTDLLREGSVLRGDRVRLVVRDGGIEVQVAAVAMADAAPGQQVLVRPEGSKETVTATVLASDMVRIGGR